MVTDGHASGAATRQVGWVLLAFQGELRHDVTPVTVAGRPLVVCRIGDQIRVSDATCPHRGAHLGYGGELVAGGIRCPFHGRISRFGVGDGAGYWVREHPTVEIGDAVFVLIDGVADKGFAALAAELRTRHELIPGFRFPVAVDARYVIENVFDAEHFQSVHKVSGLPRLQVYRGADGELIVDGALESPAPSVWQDAAGHSGPVVTRLRAHVVSPNLVITELGPADAPNVVITGATPGPGGTVIRVAVLLPRPGDGTPIRPEVVEGLIADSRTAFEQDVEVWEHLIPGAPQNFDERDDAVIAFRRFCAEFDQPTPIDIHPLP